MEKCIEINFRVWVGDEWKPATLQQIPGMGDKYHFGLRIDGIYADTLFMRGAVWVGPECVKWGDKKFVLTTDDVQALGDRVMEAFAYQRRDITIEGIWRDEIRKTNLFEVSSYVFDIHILSGGWWRHRGRIWKEEGKWLGEVTHGAWEDISGMDVHILGSIIDEYPD